MVQDGDAGSNKREQMLQLLFLHAVLKSSENLADETITTIQGNIPGTIRKKPGEAKGTVSSNQTRNLPMCLKSIVEKRIFIA